MSTRCTIAYSDDFHLYQECFEQDNVYLRLDSGDWAASLDTSAVDWRDGESTRPQLHVKMNVTLWRQIVEGWMKSHWGQHPEDDHGKIDFDPDAFNSWLSSLPKKKEEDNKEVDNDQQGS